MIQPLFLLMRWLQTVPLALMMFTPFEDRELRWGRLRSCLAAAGYMLLTGVFLSLLSAAASTGGQRNIAARDISLAAVLVVYFCLWGRAVRAPAVWKVLVGELILHYAAMLNAISNVFAEQMLAEDYLDRISADRGSVTFCLCLLAATALTAPFVWYFLRRILRRSLPMLDEREARRGIGYLCAGFILFALATYNPRYQLGPEIPLFVAALIVTDVITYYIFFREIGAVRRQAETARELAVYQMQYRQISRAMEETRRLRHDLRHHLNTLGALNARGAQEEVADYLKRYGMVYDRLEGRRYSGDPVVDSLLAYYLTQAEEDGADVCCRVELGGPTGVDAVDMTVLLGNCLENALEALRALPEDRRQLSIEMLRTAGALLVRIRNTCGEGDSGDFAGYEAFPSRKRPRGRGVGLRSVSAIAEQYGGSARFRRQNGEFTARVVLNMAREEPGEPGDPEIGALRGKF